MPRLRDMGLFFKLELIYHASKSKAKIFYIIWAGCIVGSEAQRVVRWIVYRSITYAGLHG